MAKIALMVHLLVEMESEEVSGDPLMEAWPEAAEMEEMEVMQMAEMVEMGDEEGIIVLIVLQHILFGFI